MLKKFSSILILSFLVTNAYSQRAKTHVLTADEAKIVKKDAASMFSSEDYRGALSAYLDLYKSDQTNVEYNFRLGYCYLMTNVNKKAALKYMEYACLSKDAKKEWNYFLGLAYIYDESWDEAINVLNEVKESAQSKSGDFLSPSRLVEMCRNGKKFTANPVSCTFSNPGKTVNTSYDEYNPFISGDNKSLLYSSRRKGNMGGFIEDLGIYTSDIYWTIWKDTIWSKARSIGANVNSEWDEETVGLSPAGDQLFMFFDNAEAFGDIAFSTLKGKVWQRPFLLSAEVNSKAEEYAGCISADGKTIFFSSNKKDSHGRSDLYMVKREKNLNWTKPENLGLSINTVYDEINPSLSTDGKTLYFASKGWDSMGGYDIFYCQWDESQNKWSAPVNMGYPINNAEDNTTISMTADQRFAYVSAVRKEGFGDRDIYKIEFTDTSHHSFKAVISGMVAAKSELTKIQLENKKTGEVMDYNEGTTTNHFVFAVNPGEYTLNIEGYKFAPVSEEITVTNDFPPVEINKVIQIKTIK